MTSPTTTYTSWLDWLDSRDSADVINKTHQAELFNAFSNEIDADKSIEEIIQHEETAFLFEMNFGASNVNIFHHLKKIGGTIYQPSTSYGFLQGLEKGTTWPMTPDIEVLGKKPEGAANSL